MSTRAALAVTALRRLSGRGSLREAAAALAGGALAFSLFNASRSRFFLPCTFFRRKNSSRSSSSSSPCAWGSEVQSAR